MLSPRQEMILRKVVDAYTATGLPVGSKTLAADQDLGFGPSTIRHDTPYAVTVGTRTCHCWEADQAGIRPGGWAGSRGECLPP